MSAQTTADAGRAARIEFAKRFAWGYRNYVGGSDDWRCDIVVSKETDEFGEYVNDDYEPCVCPECRGATVRAFDSGKPSLSTRVKLNLASAQVQP